MGTYKHDQGFGFTLRTSAPPAVKFLVILVTSPYEANDRIRLSISERESGLANFNTHVSVASGVSLAASMVMIGANIAQPKHVLACFSLGVIGGILPDIDLDHSTTVRLLFSFLTILLTFSIMFGFISDYSIAELLIACMVIFLSIRYGLYFCFMKWTVHRGIFHSIPAGFLFSLLAVLLASRAFGMDHILSWLCGGFLLLGYLTHLTLDEIYSVDFSNSVLKESFRTALKFFHPKQIRSYLVLYLAIAALFFITPSPKQIMDQFGQAWTRNEIGNRLLPHDTWFLHTNPFRN